MGYKNRINNRPLFVLESNQKMLNDLLELIEERLSEISIEAILHLFTELTENEKIVCLLKMEKMKLA